jgi:hypothetical protein
MECHCRKVAPKHGICTLHWRQQKSVEKCLEEHLKGEIEKREL